MPSQTFNSFYSSVYQHRKGSFHRLFAHKKSLFAFIFVIRVLYHMWESTMVINIIYHVVLEKFAGYFCSLEYHSKKKKILFTGMPCQNWYTFFFFPLLWVGGGNIRLQPNDLEIGPWLFLWMGDADTTEPSVCWQLVHPIYSDRFSRCYRSTCHDSLIYYKISIYCPLYTQNYISIMQVIWN